MKKARVTVAICLLFACSPAAAAVVSDPTGDFLPTFTGAKSADLDVTNFSVVFDGTNFLLGATLAGAISAATAANYVIGINTGAGALAPFGDVGEPDVKFDQTIALSGATGVALLGNTSLTDSITGDAFSILVPASLLPSTGSTPQDYGFNLWPQLAAAPGHTNIADFAPQNALLSISGGVSAVPEPRAWETMLLGFGLIGGFMRLRRRSTTKLAALA
jgi:hypothetical protein